MTEDVDGAAEPGQMERLAGPWSTALRVASLVTALLTVAVVARSQGTERFGSWTVAVAIVSGLLILDLGLGNALVRASARLAAAGHSDAAPGQLAASRRYAALRISGPIAALAVLVAVVLLATGATLGGLDGLDLGSTVVTIGLVGPALALLGMAPRVRIGLGEVPQSSKLGLIGCAVQVVVVLACVWMRAPLGLLVAANFTSQLVGWSLDSLAVWRASSEPRPTAPDPQVVRDGRRYQLLVIAGYAGFNADAILVGTIVGPAAAGLVAMAARVILTPQMIVTSWFTPRWGSVARAEVQQPDHVAGLVVRTVIVAGSTSTAATVAAGLLSQPLIRIIAGPEFQISIELVWATVAAGTVLGIAAALSVVLNGLGLVTQQLRLSVASAAANLTLGVLLCLHVGAVGAPLATAIAHGLIGIPMSLVAVRDRLRSSRPGVVGERAGRS